jgi:hypothetical protein
VGERGQERWEKEVQKLEVDEAGNGGRKEAGTCGRKQTGTDRRRKGRKWEGERRQELEAVIVDDEAKVRMN